MGRIAAAAGLKKNPVASTAFPGQSGGRAIWRQVFGTEKERGFTSTGTQPNTRTDGGGHANSVVGNDASIKRLLEALRSKAPGGWSDNRFEQQRHFVGIAYVAIHRQNEMLTQAEFQVFIRDPSNPEGKRPVTRDDPPQNGRMVAPYDLVTLLQKPNPEDSFGDLLAQWNLNMETTGTALTWMVPNQLGVPFELYPIPTSIAVPQPSVNPEYPHGFYRIQPVYPYGPFSSYPSPVSAAGAAVASEWMMKIKYPHPFLRYEGYSPMTALRLHLDEVESIDRSRWYNMKKTFRPTAVLQFEDAESTQGLPQSEIERIVAEFEASFQSPENTGKLFVSAPGSRIEEFGSRPIDMDYQQGWEQLVSFALAGFGITRPAAGMIEDSSYSTLFATLKQLYWLTLEPKADRIANKITRNIAPFFGDDLIVEIRCRRIDDHEVTFKKLDIAIGANAVTKNEVRQELDFPMTTEPWGDEIATLPPMPPAPPGMVVMPDGSLMPDPNAMPPQGTPFDPTGMLNPIVPGVTEEEDPIEQGRPGTGSLGQGALGPRKSLESTRNKSLESLRRKYRQYTSPYRNGNGKH